MRVRLIAQVPQSIEGDFNVAVKIINCVVVVFFNSLTVYANNKHG